MYVSLFSVWLIFRPALLVIRPSEKLDATTMILMAGAMMTGQLSLSLGSGAEGCGAGDLQPDDATDL